VARPTKYLRLFVAAYPPPDIAALMHASVQRLALPERTRFTPSPQIHLTLQFIGDVPVADLDATIESVQRAAAGLPRFTLRLQRLIALPQRGPKRLLAVETDAPATLMELHTRLALRLAGNPRDRPGRDYRPHITLCRFAGPVPVQRLALDEQQAMLTGSFEVREILLMRSTLSAEGATHHPAAAVALG
jgi:2'-5' RNA ligase